MKFYDFTCHNRSLPVWPLFLLVLVFGCHKQQQSAASEATEQADNERTATTEAAPIHTSMKLFDGGNESIYHSFRIPSIIKTKNGTLVAFAEGRRWSPSDYGDINVVFKRSLNNGSTWSALGEVAASGSGTWGNPTAVYDPASAQMVGFGCLCAGMMAPLMNGLILTAGAIERYIHPTVMIMALPGQHPKTLPVPWYHPLINGMRWGLVTVL